MKKPLKLFLIFVLLNLVIISQISCVGEELNIVSKTTYAFDTVCEVTIYEMDRELAYSIIDELFKKFNYYENLFSNKISDSEISRINNGEEFEASFDVIELLEKGIYYGEISDGIFDITVGSVTALWNFHTDNYIGEVPDKSLIEEEIKHINYRNIDINDNVVTLKDKDSVIDLGGIAKGYIADKACEFLKEKGVTAAVINLGGNIETIGGKEEGGFNIGVTNPLSKEGSILGAIRGRDMTVVTSGTYQRYFIGPDGKNYHHILDVNTGYPVQSDILQVTIISSANHSIDCDCLSTTVLSLGIEKGLEFIKQFDFCEAIILDYDGNIYYSNEETQFVEY